MRVFISYRRDDSMVTAALVYKELVGRAEFADAFMDIDDIGYGDDFVTAIDTALHQADVVLVVIGPRWLELLTARVRGDDWVRHEVATALRMREPGAARQRPLRVLPVLVGGADSRQRRVGVDNSRRRSCRDRADRRRVAHGGSVAALLQHKNSRNRTAARHGQDKRQLRAAATATGTAAATQLRRERRLGADIACQPHADGAGRGAHRHEPSVLEIAGFDEAHAMIAAGETGHLQRCLSRQLSVHVDGRARRFGLN